MNKEDFSKDVFCIYRLKVVEIFVLKEAFIPDCIWERGDNLYTVNGHIYHHLSNKIEEEISVEFSQIKRIMDKFN